MTSYDPDTSPAEEEPSLEKEAMRSPGAFSTVLERLQQDASFRMHCVEALERADAKVRPQVQDRIEAVLTPLETRLLHDVDALAFTEGSWYRVTHNRIVPLSMKSIIHHENAPEDLMLAAIAHDAGYAMIAIAKTTAGPDWQAPDRRVAHMKEGADYIEKTLLEYRAEGVLSISDARIQALKEIVARHDDPYLGKALQDAEALLHRDADRCFVMSHLSFWKDYLAYLSSDDWSASLKVMALDPRPETLIQQRLASFYPEATELPEQWDSRALPLEPGYAVLNEGGAYEAIVSDAARTFVDEMFLARAEECKRVALCDSIEDLEKFFEESLYQEFDRLLTRVESETGS